MPFLLAVLGYCCSLQAGDWRQLLENARGNLEKGDLVFAERDLQRAILAIHKSGPEHLPVFEELQVLGAYVAEEGNLDKGCRLVRRSLALAEEVLGKESPRLEPFKSMLGVLELQAGNARAAVGNLRFSFQLLDGVVPVTQPAFREVIQNYAEALRETGETREFLSLFSRYGHLVDLGSLQDAEGSPRISASPPSPPAFPPDIVKRGLANLQYDFQALPLGRRKLREVRRWLRNQLGRVEGWRRIRKSHVQEMLDRARNKGRELAFLAMVTGKLRKKYEKHEVPAVQAVFQQRMGEIVGYEALVTKNVERLRKLLMKLGADPR
jgi:hypothetical protein